MKKKKEKEEEEGRRRRKEKLLNLIMKRGQERWESQKTTFSVYWFLLLTLTNLIFSFSILCSCCGSFFTPPGSSRFIWAESLFLNGMPVACFYAIPKNPATGRHVFCWNLVILFSLLFLVFWSCGLD